MKLAATYRKENKINYLVYMQLFGIFKKTVKDVWETDLFQINCKLVNSISKQYCFIVRFLKIEQS